MTEKEAYKIFHAAFPNNYEHISFDFTAGFKDVSLDGSYTLEEIKLIAELLEKLDE